MHKDTASTITNSVPEIFSKKQIIPQQAEPINITPLPPSGTAATIEAQKTEKIPSEYKEFLKYGIKPREAKYYEHE